MFLSPGVFSMHKSIVGAELLMVGTGSPPLYVSWEHLPHVSVLPGHSLSLPSCCFFYIWGEGGFSRPAPIDFLWSRDQLSSAGNPIRLSKYHSLWNCKYHCMSILIKPEIFIHCENVFDTSLNTNCCCSMLKDIAMALHTENVPQIMMLGKH